MKRPEFKKIIKNALYALLLLLIMNALYLLFMVLAFHVPADGSVRAHIEETMEDFTRDVDGIFFHNDKVLSTGFVSDLYWLDTAAMRAEHPFYNAVALPAKSTDNVNEDGLTTVQVSFYKHIVPLLYYYDDESTVEVTYERYWMLMTGAARILLLFINWIELRHLLYGLSVFVLCLDFYLLIKKLSWQGFVPFAMAVFMRNLLLHTASFITFTDSFLAFSATAAVLAYHDSERFRNIRPFFYLVLGSFTYALGTMEAPLITLGIPLLTEVMLKGKEERSSPGIALQDGYSGRAVWTDIFLNSFVWTAGYAFTIGAKSVLARIVLGSANSSAEHSMYYMSSHGTGIAGRFLRVADCFGRLFMPRIIKVPMLCAVLLLIILYLVRHDVAHFPYIKQMALITCFPLIWSFIAVEHSIHSYADNIYAVFVYGSLGILTVMTADKKKEKENEIIR